MGRVYNAVELIPAIECVRETLVSIFLDAAKNYPMSAYEMAVEMPDRLIDVDNLVLLAYAHKILEGFNGNSFELTSSTQTAFDSVLAGFNAGDEDVTRDDYIRQGICAYFDRDGVRMNDKGEEEPYKQACGEILSNDILKASLG